MSHSVPLPCHPRALLSLCLWAACSIWNASAQIPDITVTQHPEPQTPTASAPTMFPHPGEGRFWLSGQLNFIAQHSLAFDAKYSGQHSFRASPHSSAGHVVTIYAGVQLGRDTELLVDGEQEQGLGLSSALGLGGFTNLDAVRDPTLTAAPYLSRLMLHHVIPLSRARNESDRGPLSTFSELPERRFELRVGRFGITDFFD